MKMVSYYILHTFKNQILKIFKTWVFILILVCGLLGGVIGFIGGTIAGENAPENVQEEIMEETEVADKPFLDNEKLELGIGVMTMVMFFFAAFMADQNGGSIFLPADVNLLFPSPLKPHNVLMFRVITKMGIVLFATLYILIFFPPLLMENGYGPADIGFLAIGWGCILGFSQLLQVILYTVGATFNKARKVIRYSVYAVALLLAAGYGGMIAGGHSYYEGAVLLFNGRVSRMIPLWGWIKGSVMYGIEKNYGMTILMLVLVILTFAGMIYFLKHFKADFYEDAMAKSEQTAELMERMQEGRSLTIRRTKDRSDNLKRDGIKHGCGANMLFYKEMYNRFRFAHFRVFTKTSETYLLAAVVAVMLKSDKGVLPAALLIGAFAFFRSLGNSLEQELNMPYFRMMPEKTWKKFFYSLAGSGVNSFLDMIPGMAAAVVITKDNPLNALAWMLVIVTLCLYSTSVAAFIGQSVPVSAGAAVKQVVQIMFVYFGLLPDVAVIALGMNEFKGINLSLSMIIAACVNMGITFLMIFLTSLFIEPSSRPYREPARELTTEEIRNAKKCFSCSGWMLVIFYGAGSVAQMIIGAVIGAAFPEAAGNGTLMFLLSFLMLYSVGLPLATLATKKIPVHKTEIKSMSLGQLLYCVPIAICFMYAGNLLSMLVNLIIVAITGGTMANPLEAVLNMASPLATILVVVIIGPLVEEFVFRRVFIDRMRLYGEKQAVIVSALLFALFHGNFAQLFYAFLLGLLFGYVYVKTGKLRYSYILHMIVNFMGSVIGPWIISMNKPEAVAAYGICIIAAALAGCVMLCVKARTIHFEPAPLELRKKTGVKARFVNPGMIVVIIMMTAICLLMIN